MLRVYSAPSATAPVSYSYQPYAAVQGQPYTYQQYYSSHYNAPADVPVNSSHSVGATERAGAGEARRHGCPALRGGGAVESWVSSRRGFEDWGPRTGPRDPWTEVFNGVLMGS